jgi:osmotically inducible protein OsmC
VGLGVAWVENVPVKPLYTTSAISTGDGRNGHTALADGSIQFDLAVQKELGGTGDGANPEELFALGYAACFHSALKLVGRAQKKSTAESAVIAEVTIGQTETGFGLAVKLEVELPALANDEARALAEAAHDVCPYSRATRGNIPVELTVT